MVPFHELDADVDEPLAGMLQEEESAKVAEVVGELAGFLPALARLVQTFAP